MRGDQSFRVTEQIFSDTTDGRELLDVGKNVFEMGKREIANKRRNFIATNCFSDGPIAQWCSEKFSASDRFIVGVTESDDECGSRISLSLGKIKLPWSEKCCSLTYGLHVYYLCWKWTHFFWQLFLSLRSIHISST